MVNFVKIVVRHESGELIQIVDDEGVHDFTFFPGTDEMSYYDKRMTKVQEKFICSSSML